MKLSCNFYESNHVKILCFIPNKNKLFFIENKEEHIGTLWESSEKFHWDISAVEYL